MTTVIQARGLTKRVGEAVALDGVDLDVSRGDCVGLAGANGSGRTTLLRVLAGLTPPSSGSLVIDGIDVIRRPLEARSRTAYVGTPLPNGSGLRVHEYVAFVLGARRTPQTRTGTLTVSQVVERAQLPADAGVDGLSDGLRHRLALASALAVAPPVLLLDDPLHALDPTARRIFVEWLADVRECGTTILMAINDEGPVASLCQQVARMDRGRVASSVRVPDRQRPGLAQAIPAEGER